MNTAVAIPKRKRILDLVTEAEQFGFPVLLWAVPRRPFWLKDKKPTRATQRRFAKAHPELWDLMVENRDELADYAKLTYRLAQVAARMAYTRDENRIHERELRRMCGEPPVLVLVKGGQA